MPYKYLIIHERKKTWILIKLNMEKKLKFINLVKKKSNNDNNNNNINQKDILPPREGMLLFGLRSSIYTGLPAISTDPA